MRLPLRAPVRASVLRWLRLSSVVAVPMIGATPGWSQGA